MDSPTPLPPNIAAQLERSIDAFVPHDFPTALTVGIVRRDAILFHRSTGMADISNATGASAETVYRIASLTKPITATLMVRLCELGFFSLDDPLEKFIPELRNLPARPANAPPITFRTVASHAAALAKEPALEGASTGPSDHWEQIVLRAIPTIGPGKGYCNIGYALLGLALGRAAGKPFVELLSEHILAPLAMHDTSFTLSPSMRQRLARGYVIDKDGSLSSQQSDREHSGRGYKIPNGGLYSTLTDLARFTSLHLGAATQFPNANSFSIMRDLQSRPTPTCSYGLGFEIHTDTPSPLLAHSGDFTGYACDLLLSPAAQIAIISLTNRSAQPPPLRQLNRRLLDIVHPA
jgi:CubicO group peptidase (beta-lactamase class C family)